MPEIQMPKLSDTMTEGTLVSWKKKIGDKVIAGEVLAEIETDKATMEWEATDDGVLKKIYVPEGGKVNVGDRIAFIGGEGEEAPDDSAKTKKREEKEERSSEREAGEPEKAPAEKEGEACRGGRVARKDDRRPSATESRQSRRISASKRLRLRAKSRRKKILT